VPVLSLGKLCNYEYIIAFNRPDDTVKLQSQLGTKVIAWSLAIDWWRKKKQ